MDETVGVGVGPAERAHHAGGDGPTPEPRRRMSARRKQETVLRLLRGEDLELLSRELGVTAAELSGWREAFLAAGEAALKTRPADARDAEIGRLKEKVGDLTMANELLGGQDRAAGDAAALWRAGGRGDEPAGLALHRSGLRLQRVTRIWGVSRATVYRHRQRSEAVGAQAARAAGRDGGRGAGGGDPAAPAGQPLSWRGRTCQEFRVWAGG